VTRIISLYPSPALRELGPAEPDTTIVVPVWGAYGGSTLLEALASLRAQDPPARILVVDNASDEPLPDLGDAEVVVAPRRLTVGAARNLGLERVRTPYVLFWDADDLMLPGTLPFLRERLAGDDGVIAAASAIMEEEPRMPHRWPRPWTAPLTRFPKVFALAHSVWSLFPSTGSTIMRSAAVKESGGYADANSGEDWVLGVSLAFRGRLEIHSRPGRVYRRRVGSLWERRRAPRHHLRHGAAVRERLRSDPGIPRWAKQLVPAIAVLQVIAVVAVRPLAKAGRALIQGGRGEQLEPRR
jgi:glycosyltransferase involved in cell wall biosynthesis